MLGLQVLVALVLIPLLVPTFAARAEGVPAGYPKVAGTNVIHADGVAGLKMEFPSNTRWFRGNIEIVAAPETGKAFFGIRKQGPNDEWCDFCFTGGAEWMRVRGTEPVFTVYGCDSASGEESGCQLLAGPAELYFVANGPFTLTMRFPDLPGSIELDATGSVRGEVVPIPIEGCGPADTCDHLSYGGLTREIGLDGVPAFATSSGYTYAEPQRDPVDGNPAYNRFVSCVYPGLFAESKPADAQGHPYGCDAVEDPTDRDFPFWWGALPWVNGGGNTFSWPSFKTHGTQYFGFAVREVAIPNPARSEAWALWVEAGISCPSGNFSDCGAGE